MAHRGMTKLRSIEKAGLIVLCVVMIAMLGVSSQTCSGGGGGAADEVFGTIDVAGEKVEIDRLTFGEYTSYVTFQNYVLGGPPSWKFARNLFNQLDAGMERYSVEDEDLWTFITLHQAALATGVEITPEMVATWVRKFPGFQVEGKFSRERYLAFIEGARNTWPTPLVFEALVAKYLAVEYFVSLYQPLLRPTSAQVYDQWKTKYKRHDIEYIIQDAASLRGGIDVTKLEPAEVKEFYDRPDIRGKFLVPTRRTFESMSFVPGTMTDEAFAALKQLADEKELVYIGPNEAFQYFHANQDSYPIEPIREKSRKEWEEAHPKDGAEEAGEVPAKDDGAADGENAGEDDAGADEEAPADDPAPAGDDDDDAPPTVNAGDGDDDDDAAAAGTDEAPGAAWQDPAMLELSERFDRYFKVQVERELFVRRLLKSLLVDERLDKAGLETLAGKWGATYFVSEEPLDQYELLDVESIGGSQLREAMNRHGPADEGAYSEEVLVNGVGEDRALFVYRVKSVINEHYPDVSDTISTDLLREIVAQMLMLPFGDIEKMNARELMTKAFPDADLGAKQEFTVDDVLRQMLRQSKAEDLATEKLNVVREMVAQGQTFAGAAKEKGYELFTKKGLSSATPIPPEIIPAEGEQLTPREKQKNLESARLRFLVRGWMPRPGSNLTRIAETAPDSFVAGDLADKKTDSAYLVFVTAHTTPGPEEMPEIESRQIWLEMVNRTQRNQMQAFFSWERMVARYKIAVPGMTDKKESTGQ